MNVMTISIYCSLTGFPVQQKKMGGHKVTAGAHTPLAFQKENIEANSAELKS